jgi:ABC-type transport system substrate-binding protein
MSRARDALTPRRARGWVAGLAAVTLAVAGCGGDGDTGASNGDAAAAGELDRDGTLTVGWTVPALPLDPHTTNTTVGQYPYVAPVYDRLTNMAGGRTLEPMLATEWETAEDGLTQTYHLRDDATFHDGTPVDAAAVKASLDRALNLPQSTVKTYLSMVAGVEVVDPQTVAITTNRPAADLPYVLASSAGSIINPAALNSGTLDTQPAGSGPYEAVDVALGDRVVYQRAENYWDEDAQKVATLEIVGITDDNARLSALRSGEIDAMLSKIGQYEQVSNLGDGFRFHSFDPASTYSLYFNTGRGPLADAQVRQALNWAVDRDTLAETILNGQCAPTNQTIAAGLPGHVEGLEDAYGYDPERAEELLAEAGYADGFSLTLLTGAGLQPQASIAPVIQDQLSEIGVDVEVVPHDAATTTGEWAQGGYDMHIQTRLASPTPATTIRDNFLTSRFPGPKPEGLEELVAESLDPTLSEDERTDVLEEANTLITEQALDLFLCQVPTQFAYADHVVGVEDMGWSDLQGIFDTRYLGVTEE